MPLTIFPPREYGSMHQVNAANIITVSETDTFYNIYGFSSTLTQWVTFQNWGEFKIEVSWIYNINYQSCFTNWTNTEYDMVIGVNWVEQNNTITCSKKSNSIDVMQVSSWGLLNLEEDDIVTLMVANVTNLSDPEIIDANVNLTRYE